MNALIFLAAVAGSPALEPVIVTATRTEVPAADTLASVDIITGSNLQMRPAADLGDALRFVPGRRSHATRRSRPADVAVRARHGVEPRARADGRAAHQSRHHRHGRAPERRARVRRARRGREGPALDALRLRRDRRRHQHHHAPWRQRRRPACRPATADYDTTTASFIGRHSATRRRGATLAADWLDSAGFPTRVGDDQDRGYENTSFTGYARAGVGPVEAGRASAWYASGHVRVLGLLRHCPSTRTSRTRRSRCRRTCRQPRRGRSKSHARARRRRPRAEPVRGLPRHQAQHHRLAERLRALGSADTLTAGVLWQDEEADAESFGAPYAADTTSSQVYVQDQAQLRPAPPAARRGLHRPRNLRRARDLERRVWLAFGDGCARHFHRRARGSARRTQPTCTASAATRTSTRRSRRAPKLSLAAGDR